MITPKIIKREYKSGFKAEIILKPHFYQRFFGIIIDFGSSDPQKVAGSAHFLEHKLFAKKDGDLSAQFEEIGADVNAFTSFNETMFYCSGIEHTPKMIELLFRLVGEPYFTKQNIAKEAPIIEQELAMYQDDPLWKVNNAIMTSMFGYSNLGTEVVGTKESINQVTKQNLTKVYTENYVPTKMQFVACGDFSDNQVRTILRQVGKLQAKYLADRKAVSAPIVKPTGEFSDQALSTGGNSRAFGLGIRFENFKKVLSSSDLTQILLEIMLESKLSVMSPWFERMRKEGLLANLLQISVNYTRQGDFATIFGVSADSQRIIEEIKRVLTQPVDPNSEQYRFIKDNFVLQKKEWLARTIRTMNNLSYLAIEMIEESLDHEDLQLNLLKLQTMGFEEFDQICQKLMKDSTICSAYLNSKGEEK
ncbi:M16 family metallopeptidase [Lactobacillus helveticus]|uniref:M16 family metallopeptidase n=1 Tax=Lactobacillus helveticus TaxID=1587 RepID=UPI0015628B20|nr:pitrilysin family protein [Lactobacillus helveticus]NRO26168.1 putative zinc protease [Lactobacillus helveticus]